MKCKPMITVKDWDRFKEEAHGLWTEDVHRLVKRYFGALPLDLSSVQDMNLPACDGYSDSLTSTTNEIFHKVYIVDTNDHSDEREELAAGAISSFISPDHIHCYAEIQKWTEEGSIRTYDGTMNKVLYDEFPVKFRLIKDPGEAGCVLCGRRGSGKTSKIKYNIDCYERENLFTFIAIKMDRQLLAEKNPKEYFQILLIWQTDQLVKYFADKASIDYDKQVLERFSDYWQGTVGNCWPDDMDSAKRLEEKRQRRDTFMSYLAQSKFSNEFIPYMKSSVRYLEKLTAHPVILVVDDIDHLESHKEARDIFESAVSLRGELKRPLLISVREETIPKLRAKPVFEGLLRVHIVPPSLKKVLQQRLQAFKSAVQSAKVDTAHYSKEQLLTYVSIVINSICERKIYARLVTFHYDLDILLDMVRCLLSSPFLPPELVFAKGRVGWNLMLNSFQKYVYQNHYDQNSFFLNIYDNSFDYTGSLSGKDDICSKNAIVRSRLLALLVYRYSNKPATDGCELPNFSCQNIIEDMISLGYSSNSVWHAMHAFAAHRLIRTGRFRNELDENQTEISISTAVIFYYDYLIYEYRYIENILPTTPIDFHFNVEVIPDTPETSDLNSIDDIILKFADFIQRCEKEEANYPQQNKELFKLIWAGSPLSERIKASVRRFKEGRS